ncbi:hypothetical protein [Streptomyces sp. NPDC102437]|uniref:hypothetical protein n=1 Tax=Streptomyces sp. NPDC102437 TaxID=3366175 RepID=UPI0037FCA7BA
MSAIKAGKVLAPSSLVSMTVGPFAGRLSDRIGGKYLLLAGLTLYASPQTSYRLRPPGRRRPVADWMACCGTPAVRGFTRARLDWSSRANPGVGARPAAVRETSRR